MPSDPRQIGAGRWRRMPGLIELAHSHQPDRALTARATYGDLWLRPEFARELHFAADLPTSTLTARAASWGPLLDMLDTSGRLARPALGIVPATSWWSDLLDWLRGYDKDAVLLDHAPTWVPLVQVYAPPGGSATVTYTQTDQQDGAAGFKLLGTGFGTSGTFCIQDALTVPVSQGGKQILVRLLVTCTRYVRADGAPPIYRLDFAAQHASAVPIKVDDLATPEPGATGQPFDPSQWRQLGTIDLSQAHDPVPVTRTYDHTGTATWEIGLGISVSAPANLDLTAKASFAHSEEWLTTFKLPYGYTYILYACPNETPLVPMIARL